MITDTANWPTGVLRLTWRELADSSLPVTGVHGFCFQYGDVLICSIAGRGATIPGGHIEVGESPEDCLIREVREEASAEIGNLRLLGFIEADHGDNLSYSGPYPVRSVQAIYRADVVSISEFSKGNESMSRKVVSPGELPSIHHEWNAVLDVALAAALSAD